MTTLRKLELLPFEHTTITISCEVGDSTFMSVRSVNGWLQWVPELPMKSYGIVPHERMEGMPDAAIVPKRFRSKPTEIEAYQWTDESQTGPGVYKDADGFYVVTCHKVRTPLEPNDWVILEPAEKQTSPNMVYAYPCKPDVFAVRYERVRMQSLI